AMREDCPVVPESVISDDELIQEIRGIWKGIRVRDQFEAWTTASRDLIPREHGGNSMYLIEVDIDKKKTNVQAFSDSLSAFSSYANAERRNRNLPASTAVLVSASSVNQLRSAFASYYGDTKTFLDQVERFIR